MIGGFAWPDLVIAAIILFATYKGFSRGFVSELGGAVAIVVGLVAPRYYNGSADALIDHWTKFGLAASHAVGMFLTGVFAYVVVLAIAAVLNRVAKLPILGLGNALAGGLVGLLKGAVLIWLVLFVALFFPLTPPVRDALHRSRLAPYFTTFNGAIDSALEFATPPFAKPWLQPYFDRHRL